MRRRARRIKVRGGWRYEEAGKEDGGVMRQWARRMGGMRRRARRMEVRGGGRGGWRYEEVGEEILKVRKS